RGLPDTARRRGRGSSGPRLDSPQPRRPGPPVPRPDSPQPPLQPLEERSSHESQAEFSSRQIKSDKADNISDPERNSSAVAGDENTGHNQTAAGLAPAAVDAPADGALAADAPPAAAPPDTGAAGTSAAAAGSAPSETPEPAVTAESPVAAQPGTAPPECVSPVSAD